MSMGNVVDDKARIGRSGYWTAFVINLVAVVGLIGGCVVSAASGHVALAIVLLLAVLPVGLYFRVVMMRRCRDIGWPAALPWLFLGAGVAANLSRIGSGMDALRDPASAALPLVVGLVDFVFMIAIGCVATRTSASSYARHFAPDDAAPARPQAAKSQPVRPQPVAEPNAYRDMSTSQVSEEARWDAAIARALEAHQRGESADAEEPVPGSPLRPSGLASRPAGGFGRRGI